MTTIMLDETLAPIALRAPYPGCPDPREVVLSRCLSRDARKYDWRAKTTTETELVFATSLPAKADHFHWNYLGYLQSTYGMHQNIMLAPHHFWYTVLAEIAQAVVGDPEKHRPLFTRDPSGKIDIIVPCSNENEPLRMDALYAEMIGYIPVDTSLFLPTFTTSTETSRLAALAAFLETCSPYYNYMMLACGHPAIRLAGTHDDWAAIVSRLVALEAEFSRVGSPVAKWIASTVGPVAEKLLTALDGKNVEWFREIFTQKRCGSGSQYVVDGWWSRLFLTKRQGLGEITDFPTHVSKVPYKTLPSGTDWNMCFALSHSNADADGFMVPDYSWVQVRKLAEPRVTATER